MGGEKLKKRMTTPLSLYFSAVDISLNFSFFITKNSVSLCIRSYKNRRFLSIILRFFCL